MLAVALELLVYLKTHNDVTNAKRTTVLPAPRKDPVEQKKQKSK